MIISIDWTGAARQVTLGSRALHNSTGLRPGLTSDLISLSAVLNPFSPNSQSRYSGSLVRIDWKAASQV